MNISVSTHLFVMYQLSRELLRVIPEHGFSTIEIWGMRPHFDCLDLGAIDQLTRDLDDLGLRVGSMHAPFYNEFGVPDFKWLSLSDPDDEIRGMALAETFRVVEVMDRFGADVLVVHGVGEWGDKLAHAQEHFRHSLDLLLERCAPAGITLAVENIMTPASRAERLVELVLSYDTPYLKICLDLGHANIDDDPVRAVEICGEHLVSLHVADNRGRQDEHMVPYQGTVPWNTIYPMVASNPAVRYFVLEFMYSVWQEAPVDLSPYHRILADAREGLRRMAGESA